MRATGVGMRERVLLLCTANRCRSPLAGALLARQLAATGWPVDVDTAGFGEPGLPATSATVEAARALGLDLTAHSSRGVARELLISADLVIGMERAHVREAVVLEQSVWPRTFTLRELVRRIHHVGPRPRGEALRAWVEVLGRARSRTEFLGVSREDDIADPTTDLTVDHGTTAATLDDLVRRLVSSLWPA